MEFLECSNNVILTRWLNYDSNESGKETIKNGYCKEVNNKSYYISCQGCVGTECFCFDDEISVCSGSFCSCSSKSDDDDYDEKEHKNTGNDIG